MQKSYYKLEGILDDKIAGDYPQVNCLSIMQCNMISSWKIYKTRPKMRFELRKKARISDLLTTTCGPNNDLLVSQKMMAVLNKFHLMTHQIWDVDLIAQNSVIKYYWIHFSQPELVEFIDFKESEFEYMDLMHYHQPINIESYAQYLNLLKIDPNAYTIHLKKIVLKERFDLSLDLFHFCPFDDINYISAPLKEQIEMEGVTGFQLENASIYTLEQKS